jgi:hypothetical protein
MGRHLALLANLKPCLSVFLLATKKKKGFLAMTPVLAGGVEADEVHAPLAAEVSPVEPVPVLKLVPGLAPGQEVVVIADLAVRDTWNQSYKTFYGRKL